MPRFQFKKLVRDGIVDSQKSRGVKQEYRILGDEEHRQELVKKIIEEAKEVLAARPDEVASELADVQQAVDDLTEKLNLTQAEVAKAQAAKKAKVGGYKKGIYIEYAEYDEDDPWIDHVRANSDRYPEIK